MTSRILAYAPLPTLGQSLAHRVRLFLVSKRKEFAMLDVDAVDESNIRLAGSVNSFYSRQLAVAAAKHVAGVRHVIDDISVIDRTSSD